MRAHMRDEKHFLVSIDWLSTFSKTQGATLSLRPQYSFNNIYIYNQYRFEIMTTTTSVKYLNVFSYYTHDTAEHIRFTALKPTQPNNEILENV